MLCSINDYLLADGTKAGGFALTNLRFRMQRIFDVVTPIQKLQDHGLLVAGMVYKIVSYQSGDDFTNIGGTNVTGDVFAATAGTPADWTNLSILQSQSPVLIDRQKRRLELSFNVQRVQPSIKDAENYINDHEETIPRTGDIKLLAMPSMAGPPGVVALVVNGSLLSQELVRQTGSFTEHSYQIVGSPLFAPTPGTDKLLLTTGDFILLTTGGKILLN